MQWKNRTKDSKYEPIGILRGRDEWKICSS